MTTLYEKITEEKTAAQKAGDSGRLETLRMTLAELHNKQIENRFHGKQEPLSDDEVIEVLRREIKKRGEAVRLFREGGRADLAEKTEKEIEMLSEYVPQPLSRAEVEKAVRELAEAGHSEFGSLMKEAMRTLGSRADGKLVAEAAKEALSSGPAGSSSDGEGKR